MEKQYGLCNIETEFLNPDGRSFSDLKVNVGMRQKPDSEVRYSERA